MPVRKRTDSALDAWWLDFRVAGRRYRLTVRAPNKRAAKELERAAIERAKAQHRQLQCGGATVGEAFGRYWSEHGKFLASKHSERGYLNRWADALGDDTPILDVTPEVIATVIAGWRPPPGQNLDTHRQKRHRQWVTDSTINHRLRFLQRFWGRAEDVWGWTLPRVPWKRLRLPEPSELPDRSVDRATVRLLLRTLSPRSRPLVMMALVTGLRRGALLRLTVGDIDTQRGILRATSKGRAGGKLTPVPMTRAVRWVLRHAPEVGKVFAVTPQLLRKDWEAARKAIGRTDLRLHDMRHTFAQRLEDADAGDLITHALHHSDPRLRRRYSKVRIERLRERLDHLNPRRRT